MPETIPLFKAFVGDLELSKIKKVFKSGFLGKWKETKKFEKTFAKYVGAEYCVGTNSGTAALHLALMACGVGKGDDVLVPNLTFVSTALVALYVGANPVWVDVDSNTLCMSPEDLERKITPKTKAVIPVHYGGNPADMDAIFSIVRRKAPGAVIIEDAAQACGASYDNGRRVGCCLKSDVTCFSFEAKKPITCGQGGSVTTNNEDIAKKVEKLAWLGITKGTNERMDGKYRWQYDVVDVNGHLGYKYHMSDVEAAILNGQLRKLDGMNAKRREIVKRYDKAFRDVNWICTLKRSEGSACWNYAMLLCDDMRDVEFGIICAPRESFIEFLEKKGISCGVHYFLLNGHSVFKRYKNADTPNAENIWNRIVVLPVYVGLTKNRQKYIINYVLDFGKKHKLG